MSEFDAYDEGYSDAVNSAIGFSGLKVDLFARMKADYLRRLHDDEGRTPRVLDVGCGVGLLHAALRDMDWELYGVDISQACLERATEANPEVRYSHFDGYRLPFESDRFDLAWTICVLHHVPPAHWNAFSAEIARVIRPGGQVAIIEHNPWNPLTRRAVANCEFDQDAVLLQRSDSEGLLRAAGLESVTTRYIETVPVAGALHGLDRVFGWLPLGAQYLTVGTKPQ